MSEPTDEMSTDLFDLAAEVSSGAVDPYEAALLLAMVQYGAAYKLACAEVERDPSRQYTMRVEDDITGEVREVAVRSEIQDWSTLNNSVRQLWIHRAWSEIDDALKAIKELEAFKGA